MSTLQDRLDRIMAKPAGGKLQGAANVLTLDLERLPGEAVVPFWTLGDYKNRRIHADLVTAWPRTILVSWKWYGTGKVEHAAEWHKGGAETMLLKVWQAYDRADVVYGHNVAAFDTRHLNSAWRDLGLPPPSPFKTLDTLTEARKTFGDESKTLAALTKRLGITTKTDKYDPDVARAAVAGDRAAQRRITAYCDGDVEASEAFVDRLRGWVPSHPHSLIGGTDDTPTCNQCWGDRLERNGVRLAQVLTYPMYRCLDCGANVQGTRHAARTAITRGVR